MPEIFAWMATPQGWASLATLTLLEIVLGIDNVIFISIAASKLPHAQQGRARRIGLSLALFLRIALLSVLVWLAQLNQPVFEVFGHGVSWRDIILIAGGAYLIYKAWIEIAELLAPAHGGDGGPKRKADTMFVVIAQIAVIDVVFALDSMITAVGMTNELPIMITAVIIAVLVMMFASEVVSNFIDRYPTTKMLALAFLLIVGFVLVADGCGIHIDRAYLYAAIGFSVLVETLNILVKRAARPDDGADEV